MIVSAAAEVARVKVKLAANFAKAKARWAWRHRTKTAGGLTMAMGGIERWFAGHPTIHLPGEGYMLLFCGGVVTAIGGYNTLAEIFGWKDDPPP